MKKYLRQGTFALFLLSAFLLISGKDALASEKTNLHKKIELSTELGHKSNAVCPYYHRKKLYHARRCNLQFEGKKISPAKTPVLTIDGYNMVPYYPALVKQIPGITRSYHSSTGTLTITYRSNVLKMKIGSRSASLNGDSITLPVAPFKIRYTKPGSKYIMIPMKAAALYLGLQYEYRSDGRNILLNRGLSLKYDGSYKCYGGEENRIMINGKEMKSAMPSITIDQVPYVSAHYLAREEYGLGLTYVYKKPYAALSDHDNRLVMKMDTYRAKLGDTVFNAPDKARMIRLTGKNKNYVMLPLPFVCQSLGLIFRQNGSRITIKSREPDLLSNIYTQYPYTMKEYASLQKKKNPYYKEVTLNQYLSYIDPARDTTDQLQFLRLDSFRPVRVSALNDLLVSKSCVGGVLYGKADSVISSARKFRIDPLYFTSQCILETGWGQSRLAKGIRSSIVAVPVYDSNGKVSGFKKDSRGNFLTKKLKKSYTAYNLFGIKAYDGAADLCGFSYAYYNKWFTIDAALDGAAEYISDNYIHSQTNQQNTLYKFRYHPTDMNHQYASAPDYAVRIADVMKRYKTIYDPSAVLQYDYPVFKK